MGSLHAASGYEQSGTYLAHMKGKVDSVALAEHRAAEAHEWARDEQGRRRREERRGRAALVLQFLVALVLVFGASGLT